MENPEASSTNVPITIQTMHKYSTGTNINWNIKEYKTPRQYLDPALLAKQRTMETQKKGGTDKNHVTKRGFYMDYDLKIAKGIPSAFDHGSNQPWSVDKLKERAKFSKVDPKLKKYTYLEKIQIDQKNRKVPGISTYSLEKSLKQKQKQIEIEATRKKLQEKRRFFYQDINFNSSSVPGPGQHNPHDNVKKPKPCKTDYKYWVGKHSKQAAAMTQREGKKPSSLSYKPMNMTVNTFDRKSLQPKSKISGFGSSPRFSYQMVDKIMFKQIRPSPNSYKTTYDWKGKKESPKFKPWNTAIWKGKDFSSVSIYS